MRNVKWTDNELAILRAHFKTAASVYVLETMLPGRDHTTIRKKANSIGLHRPDLKDNSHEKLMSVLGGEKLTVNEIAQRMGYYRSSVNFLLQRAHAEGLCHICDHRRPKGRGKCAAIWVAGAGENKLTDFSVEAARKAAAIKAQREFERTHRFQRDPITEALYGRAA